MTQEEYMAWIREEFEGKFLRPTFFPFFLFEIVSIETCTPTLLDRFNFVPYKSAYGTIRLQDGTEVKTFFPLQTTPFTIKEIKELEEKTSATTEVCKKALEDAGGDFAEAMRFVSDRTNL